MNIAARALKLKKEIEHLEKSVKIFSDEKKGCAETIRTSQILIKSETAKMARYDERIKEAQTDLTKFTNELAKIRKQVDRESIQEQRKILLAQLAALDAV